MKYVYCCGSALTLVASFSYNTIGVGRVSLHRAAFGLTCSRQLAFSAQTRHVLLAIIGHGSRCVEVSVITQGSPVISSSLANALTWWTARTYGNLAVADGATLYPPPPPLPTARPFLQPLTSLLYRDQNAEYILWTPIQLQLTYLPQVTFAQCQRNRTACRPTKLHGINFDPLEYMRPRWLSSEIVALSVHDHSISKTQQRERETQSQNLNLHYSNITVNFRIYLCIFHRSICKIEVVNIAQLKIAAFSS